MSAAAILASTGPGTDIVIAVGEAQAEVLHVTEESPVDMVAVGARRLGRVQRWRGASTSLAVVRHAGDFLSRFDLTSETKVVLLHVLPR